MKVGALTDTYTLKTKLVLSIFMIEVNLPILDFSVSFVLD